MEFFATCGTGLEATLGNELRHIGVHSVRPLKSGVSFQGDLKDAYSALLWSRVANHILLTLERVDAHDADALYESVHGIAWEEHLGEGATFAVDAHGMNNSLRDTRFTALRVKDAIVDRLRDLRGERPDVNAEHPDVLVNVVIRHEKATVSIDLSGDPLERRGYRAYGKPYGAPIRENLAAALLYEAGWPQMAREGANLVNVHAGSGTIAIEAALMAADIAPGILRAHWGFEGWLGHDADIWEELLAGADERAESCDSLPEIIAVDADSRARDYALACAKKATVASFITFFSSVEEARVAEMGANNLFACNVPAGSRARVAQLPMLFAGLASQAQVGDYTRAVFLAPDAALDAYLGVSASSYLDVRNGKSDASLRVYELAEDGLQKAVESVKVRDLEIPVLDAGAQQFASRLSKTWKARRKWAEKNDMHAFRVYDADLPDYKFAIDAYKGAGPDAGELFVHLAEYAAPKQIDPAKTARRLADALRIVPAVFEIEAKNVYVKQRLRARGGSQYSGAAGAGSSSDARAASPRIITQENGLRFEVDLGDYLDTGIFLDHRDTRELVRKLVAGKRFLNLFAYTGTVSVYAAAGGAKSTTTVDISNTYTEWAMRNMKLNKLLNRDQEFVRADVISWVNEQRHGRNRWDFIFIDPPTFSNSNKMRSKSWDVQRDHAELLIGASRLLTRGGVIMFSCNLKKFEPDVEKLAKAGVQIVDITAKTIPEDFERTPKIHSCYLLKRVG